MRRSVAALAALVVAGACTAQGVQVHGGQRQPVRVDVTTTPSGDPKQGDGDRTGGGDSDGDKVGDGKGDPEKSPTAAPPSPTPTPTPAPKVLWAEGDEGPDVRELQARLRQVAWLFAGPTGTYDDLTARAVWGFQGKRGLPRTGNTDTVTWE